jgi:hypothetical protein
MRRWETYTALIAVIIASISAFAVPGRLWYAGVAIVLLAVVGGAELHRSLTRSDKQNGQGGLSHEQLARRIRKMRDRR